MDEGLGEKNLGAVRAEMLSELVYWRNARIRADNNFLAPQEARPSILLDEPFQASQIAHARSLTIAAQLESFDRAHGFDDLSS